MRRMAGLDLAVTVIVASFPSNPCAHEPVLRIKAIAAQTSLKDRSDERLSYIRSTKQGLPVKGWSGNQAVSLPMLERRLTLLLI